MTIADDQLARIGSVLDDWDRQDAALPERERLPDPAEEAYALDARSAASGSLAPIWIETTGPLALGFFYPVEVAVWEFA